MSKIFEIKTLIAISLPLAFSACAMAQGQTHEAHDAVHQDLNDIFRKSDLDVEQWQKQWEGEDRELFAYRQEIVDAVDLAPGMLVADVGAGTGLFTLLFAEKTSPGGVVYAVEISPAFLDLINQRSEEAGFDNVVAVLGRDKQITLQKNSIDVIFLADTYHHFDYPAEILDSMLKVLKSDGRLIIIEFDRVPGKSHPWIVEHLRAGKDVFRSEIEAAGFAFDKEVVIEGLQRNYFLQFVKPAQSTQ